MMPALISLDLGLPAFLDALYRNNKTVANNAADLIAMLRRQGHTFNGCETAGVLDFALRCDYVVEKNGILTLTKLGQERIVGRMTRKPAVKADEPTEAVEARPTRTAASTPCLAGA
jgi:hypothetical protein